MKKIELTYADIELLQFVLRNLNSDYFINESMQRKINALSMRLVGMRAQLEYLNMAMGIYYELEGE